MRPRLLDQPDPSTLIVAVATLERERAIAVAYWTILALKQQQLRPEYCGLKKGGYVRAPPQAAPIVPALCPVDALAAKTCAEATAILLLRR
ncbi:MAG TPA: hypothetical protein VNI55_04690 [Gaiellaceae bacterium]|nr:hypothetical protein [Gaiellaceae bacterium]